jgi:polysaccharide biosynthesis/export protein
VTEEAKLCPATSGQWTGFKDIKPIITNMDLFKRWCVLFFITSYVVGCVSAKKQTQEAIYFRDISDSMLNKASKEFEPIIQKGDILSINVITANEQSARLFNQPNSYTIASSSSGEGLPGAGVPGSGYLVNEKGEIIFPLLGNVKAAGLTRLKLTDTLATQISRYVDSAIVSVRLLNYRVTVLGEVMKPGTYSIPSERVSVLDAIGLAGDLTVYGRRNNIRVIRNTDGQRQTAVLNLNKGDIFDSPFFYLRQNDIVYVEMNDRKIPNTDQASIRNVSIGLGIISAVGVIISTINVLK